MIEQKLRPWCTLTKANDKEWRWKKSQWTNNMCMCVYVCIGDKWHLSVKAHTSHTHAQNEWWYICSYIKALFDTFRSYYDGINASIRTHKHNQGIRQSAWSDWYSNEIRIQCNRPFCSSSILFVVVVVVVVEQSNATMLFMDKEIYTFEWFFILFQ